MSSAQSEINRPLVGILALACFAFGLAIWMIEPSELLGANAQFFRAAFVRVGLLMSAFWLALPSRHRAAAWANISPRTLVLVVLLLIVMTRARVPLRILIPALIVFALITMFLRPKTKRPPARYNRSG